VRLRESVDIVCVVGTKLTWTKVLYGYCGCVPEWVATEDYSKDIQHHPVTDMDEKA
jgi:hypothetical protein